MKLILILLWIVFTDNFVFAQVFVTRNAEISFYSKAPVEDIYAVTRTGQSALNADENSIYFKALIKSFEFEKSLMKEHFNENYLESDKYPFAEFKGHIIDDINLTMNGTFSVKVEGNLTIHNVTKKYLVDGKLVVANGRIKSDAVFPVRLADHQVKIPRIVVKNIAEVVLVTVSAVYEESKSRSQ